MKLKNKLLKIVYGKCTKCGGELEEFVFNQIEENGKIRARGVECE